MKTQTPKHVALQVGALLTAYVSITALLILLFSLINLYIPDVAEYWYSAESAESSVRGAMATLIIVFPAFVVLTRINNQSRRKETNGEYSTISRWCIYASLLVGGAIMLGDLVTLVLYFLNGEVTLRFILKVVVLLAVIGAAFMYYLADVRGYFTKRTMTAVWLGVGVSALVIASLVAGFFSISSPAEVREQRIDEVQVSDLQDMEWRIEQYLVEEGALPATLEEAYEVGEPPEAPTERARYEYQVTENGFNLCAEFGTTSRRDSESLARPYRATEPMNEQPYIANPGNWDHEAGQWCFEREVILP